MDEIGNMEEKVVLKDEEQVNSVTIKTESDDQNNNANNPEDKSQNWRKSKWTGIILALCSGFIFASVSLIVKYLKGYHALNLGFFRFLGITLLSTPAVVVQCWRMGPDESFFKDVFPLNDKVKVKTLLVLVARAVFGFTAITCTFLAVQRIPVADSLVISSCSAVFVGVAAHIFLKERCGFFPFLAAILTIVGVMVIVKPPFITGGQEYDVDTLVGVAFSLTRMVLNTLAVVTVRYLRGVNATLVVLSTGLLQIIQCVTLALILGVFDPFNPKEAGHWPLLVAIGVLSYCAQMTMTLALKCEAAGPFAIIKSSSDTLSAFLLQFVILGMIPDFFSVSGAITILTGVSIMIFRKWVDGLPSDSKKREKYQFILK